MECPRCKGKLKRVRTVNGCSQVIRYNKCLECSEAIKTIELFVVDFDSQLSDARTRAIRAERKASQLSLNLETIQVAFQSISTALSPAEKRQEHIIALADPPKRRGF